MRNGLIAVAVFTTVGAIVVGAWSLIIYLDIPVAVCVR